MSDAIWAVVVAAGSGRRFGARKQFLELDGRPLFSWSLPAVRAVADSVVLVVPEENVRELEGLRGMDGVVSDVVAGGATRAESVRAGLVAVPESAEVVVVHDAVRPFASERLFRSVVEAVRSGRDGAIPGVGITDTVKRVRDGLVVETLDRSELVSVQTPQAFRAAALRAAHAAGGDATDDAHLIEAFGGEVTIVPGEETNIKITTPADLAAAERFVLDGHAAKVSR